MKKHLLLTIAFVGAFQQSNSIQKDCTLYFKRLGIKPDAQLTIENISDAYDKIKENYELTEEARGYLTRLCLGRELSASDKNNQQYGKKIKSRINTGIFTQQIVYEERQPFNVNCIYQVNEYNYKRIIGSTLGLVSITTIGLTYWYRNELGSLVKPIFTSVFLQSKI